MSCPATGINGHIGLGGEVTHGTKGVIDTFVRMISENLRHVKDPYMSESLNPDWHDNVFFSAGRNEGPMVFELTYTGLELLWHSLFGTYVFGADAPEPGAHSHTFTFNPTTNSFPVGISAEAVRGIGGTSEQSFLGLHVTKVTIEYAARQVVRVTFDVLGTGTSFGAATAATFVSPKFVLPAHKSRMQLGAADFTIISGTVELAVPRAGDREHYGEALYKEACIQGRPVGNFSLLCEHNSDTGDDTEAFVQYYHDETEVVGLSIQHGGDIITGTTEYYFGMDATKSTIVAAFPAVQGPEINQLTIDGTITEGVEVKFINATGAQVT